MFGHIWVAYDEDHEAARWALAVGAALARAGGARLVVSHVAPPAEETVDDREGLLVELLGLREDVRRRKRLLPIVALAAPEVDAQVSVVAGRVVPELVDQLRQARPDVVVLGDGTGRVGRGLRSLAPCPVLVVREPHERGAPVVMVAADRGRRLADHTSLPLLVVPRGAPILDGQHPPAMRSPQPANRRPTLLWRLFAASALIVVIATLVLLLAPVSVSRSVVFAEVLVVLTAARGAPRGDPAGPATRPRARCARSPR